MLSHATRERAVNDVSWLGANDGGRTRDNNSRRKQIKSRKKYDKSVPFAFGEKKHRGENGTLQCSAGPERHGYHVIKDDMVSAWAPGVGHTVDVRWVPRSKEENKNKEKERATLGAA